MAIQKLIEIKKHLTSHVLIEGAQRWNESQSTFLAEAKLQDSDWVMVIDQLDTQLRQIV